jgi:hypothetical protein
MTQHSHRKWRSPWVIGALSALALGGTMAALQYYSEGAPPLPPSAAPSAEDPSLRAAPSQPRSDAARRVTSDRSGGGATSSALDRPPETASGYADARALAEAFSSDDLGRHMRAIASAASQGGAAELAVLMRQSLPALPHEAPALIAAVADIAERDAKHGPSAAATLANWLEQERRRESRDAVGNVSVLVESLGRVHDPRASEALSATLRASDIPLHVKVLAVQGLGRNGPPDAAASLSEFARTLAEMPSSSGGDQILADEARTATAEALQLLGSRG